MTSIVAPLRAWLRPELFILLELWALCGLTIAQPLLDATGRAPDFFLLHSAGPREILLLAGCIVVAPPLALWALGAVTRLVGPRVRRAVHVLTVAALSVVLAVQAGKWMLPLRDVPLAVLALAAGAAVGLAYVRWSAVAGLLRLAAIGPLAFVLLFVFASPTSPLVLGKGFASAGAGRSVGRHPPIVFLILDELPQVSLLDDNGRIDAGHFPNFARLAADSTWYRNATAVSGLTVYSVPSMLTGRFPPDKATAPHYSQYPDNLFTLLDGAYDMRVWESILQLCPPQTCRRHDAGDGLRPLLGGSATALIDLIAPWEAGGDATGGFGGPAEGGGSGADAPKAEDARFVLRRWAGGRAPSQPARMRMFTAGLRPAARPTLHFLHLGLPHQPWIYLPSGRRHNGAATLPKTGSGPGAERPADPATRWWLQLARQRHLLQVRYVDRLLGRAIDTMRASGLYDDALVVVTSDHGVAFTPGTLHRVVDRQRRNAGQLGWVPLFIKAPGQTDGAVDHRNWLHVDMLPTIADHAGVEPSWRMDGTSAAGRLRTTAEKPFIWQNDSVNAWRKGPALDLDQGTHAAAVLRGPDDALGLPPPRMQHLVGRRVGDLAVADAGLSATIANRDQFAAVDPVKGRIPAVVHGTVAPGIPADRHLAIAVNGIVGAVVPVLAADGDAPRFAGVIQDETLFRPGANRVEVFLVTTDGTGLRRLLA